MSFMALCLREMRRHDGRVRTTAERMNARTASMKGHTHRPRCGRVHSPAVRTLIPVVVALFLAVTSAAQQAPSFLIESIRVDGGTRGTERIVMAESRLQAGQTYGEVQLCDAVARVQRLPFVVSSDLRLEKGSTVGSYVLVIVIQQMKPVFALAESTTTWTYGSQYFPVPGGLEIRKALDQRRQDKIAVGARWFAGAGGVANFVAERVEDRNDRYTLSYSQYDVWFGTQASITAVASYLENPGARGRNFPGDRFDWHHRDNITWEVIGILPLAANDSLRASWQREERPASYFTSSPVTGQLQHNIRSLPQIRKELFWIHDTTNDPLFPTSGTRVSFGAIRTDTPTWSFAALGRLKIDETKLSLERSFPLTTRQAITFAANGSDFERRVRHYDVVARYSIDLWGRERTLRDGDLRLELGADRVFTRIRNDPYMADSTLRASLVFRNEWGVVRLTGQYNSWGTD